jgi:hypothetical protein
MPRPQQSDLPSRHQCSKCHPVNQEQFILIDWIIGHQLDLETFMPRTHLISIRSRIVRDGVGPELDVVKQFFQISDVAEHFQGTVRAVL